MKPTLFSEALCKQLSLCRAVFFAFFTPPKGGSVDHFTLNYDVIAHEIVTHVVLISIRSDKQHPIPANDPVYLGMIRNTKLTQDVDRFKREAH